MPGLTRLHLFLFRESTLRRAVTTFPYFSPLMKTFSSSANGIRKSTVSLTMRKFSQQVQQSGEKCCVRRLGRRYTELLQTNPIATKGITAATLGAFGDMMCQRFVDNSDTINWKRTCMFTLLNGVYVAPTVHIWYNLLARTIGAGAGTIVAVKQLVMDQFLFAPVFIASFMSLILTIEGHMSDIPGHISEHLWPTVVANWQLWIPANFLNFRYISLDYRVLFGNGVALLWNVYLSYASHKSVKSTNTTTNVETTI